jgi:hypothetical protein
LKRTLFIFIDILRKNINRRLARSWPPILVIFLAVSLISFSIYQFSVSKGISPENLTSDPNAVTGAPFYIGSVTFLYVILWTGAASFSIMGAILIYQKGSRKFWFLLSAGLYTLLLTQDDSFQLHLLVFPDIPQTSEKIVFLVYLLLILAFLIYFLQEILNDTDFLILATALLFLAASMVIDVFLEVTFIADVLKLFGVSLWFMYFSSTSIHMVKEHTRLIERK